MRRDDTQADAMAELSAHRARMAERQAEVGEIVGRIRTAQAIIDAVAAPRARLESLRDRRREALAAEYVSGKKTDLTALEAETAAVERELHKAENLAERAAAGKTALEAMRDAAAARVGAEAAHAHGLLYEATKALARDALARYDQAWGAFCAAHADLNAITALCDEYSDPATGRIRIGGMQARGAALADYPALAVEGRDVAQVRAERTVDVGAMVVEAKAKYSAQIG